MDLSHLPRFGEDTIALFFIYSVFQDFLLAFGQSVATLMPEVLHRIVWLQLEFAQLAQTEKMVVQNLFLSLHTDIATELMRFVKQEETANHLAWILLCAYFGYEQIFLCSWDQSHIVNYIQWNNAIALERTWTNHTFEQHSQELSQQG